MSKKKKKLSGKEMAKLNFRKKFYIKLERLAERIRSSKKDEVIFITMNKNHSFPESDDLSLVLNEQYIEFDEDVDFEESLKIDFIYLEEAHFILKSAKENHIAICRRETKFDNDGTVLKGINATEEDKFISQKSFNWAIKFVDFEEFGKVLAKEKVKPTVYDLTPKAAVILEPIHYKSKKPRRKRRR